MSPSRLVLLMRPSPGIASGGLATRTRMIAELRARGAELAFLDPETPAYFGLGRALPGRIRQRLRFYHDVIGLARAHRATDVVFDLYHFPRLWPLPALLRLALPRCRVWAMCLSPEKLLAGDATEQRFAPWFYIRSPFRLARNRLLASLACLPCTGVLALGPWLARFLREHLAPVRERRILTFGAGDDTPSLQPPRGDRRGWIGVGYVDPYKGVHRLIEALAQAEAAEVAIDWYGDNRNHNPDFVAYCEELARARGVASRLRFRGWVPPEELARVFAGAEGFVSAAPHEGYGLNHVEAVAHGLRLVGPRGSTSESFIAEGENGVLFDAADPTAFAAALRRARELDPARAPAAGARIHAVHRALPSPAALLLAAA